MRLKQYLNEETYTEIIETIEKDCKPFIRDWKKLNVNEWLYSGRRGVSGDIIKKKVRVDRKPLGTPSDIHKTMDDWFYKKFKVRSRSNAVFCTFDKLPTGYYGDTFLIFPIGKYKAVSSKHVFDLFTFIMDMRSSEWSWLNKKLDKLKYTDKLTYHDNEIMVTCKEYYMVDDKFEMELTKHFKK